jgi:nitrate reductase gamma subunit
MSALLLAQLVAVAGLIIGAAGLVGRWDELRRRPAPVDRARPRGNPARGVLYAFTLGMAPWAKESTRIHAAAYLRGAGFHAAVFVGLAALAARPVWPVLPPTVRGALAVLLGAGAALAAAGSLMRVRDPNLRALSNPDDHLSIWLVAAFLALTGLGLWDARFTVPMYLAAGLLFAYIPLGKIRHCLYFFFGRRFFGQFVGRRGVLPHAGSGFVEGVR